MPKPVSECSGRFHGVVVFFVAMFVISTAAAQIPLLPPEVEEAPARKASRERRVVVEEVADVGQIELSAGKSVLLRSAVPVERVSVADPCVADILLPTPYEIYVIAKAAGVTNLTLWQNGKAAAIYDLNVVYDLSELKRRVRAILPEERELQIFSTKDSITLAGKISGSSSLARLLSLVESYAPEGKVNNLVEVGGVHQVMLDVRVAEIRREVTKRLGINLFFIDGDGFGVSLLGQLGELVESEDGSFDILVSPTVNALFRFSRGRSSWTGLVDALKEDGMAKVLAKPTLIALSGQTASFLAGGEFPVPVPEGLGTVSIEYKNFGVSLEFTPTVTSPGKISVAVAPEVSELDFSTAIQFSGFVVPGISTRRAATTVELEDGQSFAIAGLLQENISQIVQKFPLLGDIPVLGALFQSKSFQKQETELVIVVTPRLVKPIVASNLGLPTDWYTEPDDVEFYLMGKMEGGTEAVVTGGNFEGEFGHVSPEFE